MRSSPALRSMPVPMLCALFCAQLLCVTASAESGPRDVSDFADGLFLRNMYEMAITEYDRFITAYPGDEGIAHVFFMRAECLFQMKRYEESVGAFQAYFDTHPRDEHVAMGYLHAGVASLELSWYDDALTFLGTAKAHAKKELTAEIDYFTALAKEEQGDAAAAAALYVRALHDTGADLYRGLAAYRRGRLASLAGEEETAAEFYVRACQITDDPEVRANAQLAIANIDFEKGEYASAIERLRELIQTTSSEEVRGKAVVNLLHALFSSEQYTEMVTVYRQVREKVTDRENGFAADLRMAQGYRTMAKHAEAQKLLDQLAAQSGITPEEQADLFFEQVNAHLAAKDYERAQTLLDETPQYASLPQYQFLRAEAAFYRQDYAAAGACYQRVIDDYPGSPFYREARYAIGYAALKANDPELARKHFLSFATEFPAEKRAGGVLFSAIALDEQLDHTEEGVADARAYLERYDGQEDARNVYFLLGGFYTRRHEYDAAIALYDTYKYRYPQDEHLGEIYYLIGYNYQQKGDVPQSLQFFTKVTKKGVADQQIYYNAQKQIAHAYLTTKRDVESADIFAGLIRDFPQNDLSADIYFWVIRTYLKAKQMDRAQEILDAYAARPDRSAHEAEYAYSRGEVLRSRGRLNEAIAAYADCVAADTGTRLFTGPACLGQGLAYYSLPDYDRAAEAFQKALDVNPEDATVCMRARYGLADVLFQKEQYDEAARLYLMVTILYDDGTYVPEALYRAAYAFDKAGKGDQAKMAANDFLKRFPQHSLVAHVRKVLKSVRNEE